MTDYYSVLGVSLDSEDIVIQAAYRALMRRYHPDVNQSSQAAQKALEINEAYAVLSDPKKRRAYDKANATSAGSRGSSTEPPKQPPPPKPDDSFTDLNLDETLPPGPRAGAAAFFIFAVLTMIAIGFALYVTRSSTASNLASSESSTSFADTNMTTENVSTNDTTAIDAMSNEGAAIAGEPPTADLGNMATPAQQVIPTLGNQPALSLDYTNIEGAAQKFASIFRVRSWDGVREYSERCHHRVLDSPNWNSADFCAPFDYAGGSLNNAPGYFDFQNKNQADNYTSAGASAYTLYTRLSSIKDAVQPALREAFQRTYEPPSSSLGLPSPATNSNLNQANGV